MTRLKKSKRKHMMLPVKRVMKKAGKKEEMPASKVHMMKAM